MAEGGYWRDETDHERAPRHRGLYNHLSQVPWKHESIETCTLMNMLGYGSHIRKALRDAYREHDSSLSRDKSSATMITTGSKAEGLTSLYESDRDIMLVRNDVICLENDVNYNTLPREMTVFTLNTEICYHGHCILFLEERPGAMISREVRDALCSNEDGRSLLSSDLYWNTFNNLLEHDTPTEVRHERAGPSMPITIEGVIHTDWVHSMSCNCPRILRKWAERHRHWPPPDVVQKVVSLGAFVTPVGFKGSENKNVEWRICFNTGENELVSSLNDTQVYIYVILKMVVKEAVKPVQKEITSYTVKNIVFWLAENNPQELFTERTLLHWLREGLGELRSAILTERLSYYMIPERNLMAACGLEECQKRMWIQMLTDMIDEGPKVLLRLPKIRQAIISHPEPLFWYSKRGLELELLCLKYMARTTQCRDANGVVNLSDAILMAIRIRQRDIIIEVHQRMYLEGSRVYDTITFHQLLLG